MAITNFATLGDSQRTVTPILPSTSNTEAESKDASSETAAGSSSATDMQQKDQPHQANDEKKKENKARWSTGA